MVRLLKCDFDRPMNLGNPVEYNVLEVAHMVQVDG